MSGYEDNFYTASLNSIARRLRIKNFQRPDSLPLERPVRPVKMNNQIDGSGISALDNQKMRLGAFGGLAQQERMIYDKRRSLDRALMYSYQGANIIHTRPKSEELLDPKPIRALINPDKLKQDYDDKILSVPYEANFKVGDIFEWLGTKTHWLIYLQDLTELAYFRGSIRRCSYEITWKDDDNIYSTYAAVRGPVETKIDYIQKHQISVDEPNHSLHLLIPQNEETLKYFKRYAKFYLKDSSICWRIEALDWISVPGIIEINAVEYYSNKHEDKDSIAGLLVVEEDSPNTLLEDAAISGDVFIKPRKEYKYIAPNSIIGEWKINSKYPVELRIDKENPKICYIKWFKGIAGQFELSFGQYTKTIVVESLF